MTTARRKPGSKDFETEDGGLVSEEQILADDGEEIKEYGITRAHVAQMLGTSIFVVRKLEKQGVLNPRLVSGYHYFEPQEVERVSEEYKRERDIEKEVSNSSEIVKAGTGLTKVAVNHLESILRLAHEPANQVLQLLMKENEALRKARETSDGKYFELLEKLEDVLQNHHERQIQREELAYRNARNERLVEMVAEYAPSIMQNFIEKDSNPVSKLVNSLTSEQLEFLKQSKFISDEQFELIMKIKGSSTDGERIQEKPERPTGN